MKKGLLLGLAVSVAGATFAFAGAFALYKKNATNIDITIGARTDTDLNYSVTNVAWNADYKALQPDVTNTLGFEIGAEKPTGSTYTQDIVVGRLSIEISSQNSNFIDYFDSKISAEVKYAKVGDSLDKDPFYAKQNRNKLTLAKTDGKLSGSVELPVDVNGQDVTMPISLPSNISNSDLMKLAEASFNVSITWEEAKDYEFAYVRGGMNNWESTDEWRMVPMINTEDFEWMYKVSGAQKAALIKDVEFKCYKDDGAGNGYSGGNNYKVTEENAGKINGIYWKGGSEALSVSIDK